VRTILKQRGDVIKNRAGSKRLEDHPSAVISEGKPKRYTLRVWVVNFSQGGPEDAHQKLAREEGQAKVEGPL
jgi:hypothetical protein